MTQLQQKFIFASTLSDSHRGRGRSNLHFTSTLSQADVQSVIMEDTALCIRLLRNVLLVAQFHLHCAQDVFFAQIVPSRLQLFEHSALYINCEGFNTSTGWTVLRKTKGKVSTCVSGWSSICTIKPAFLSDSGEYWCEGGGERSNAVNITVTDGAVILESPVLPVMEGGNVTLRCQTKMTSSAHTADFFKDGRHIGTSTTEEMIIGRVSTSDEGLYSCSISEFGESPQSWLTVRALYRATPQSSNQSCQIYRLLRTVFIIVMLVLLLVEVGLLHWGKHRLT
ncbi:low affinity immunoglobulin gamma Fc region receptor III-A-like [Acanthochromis polyacanthus]|uniref:low affinity immunoglobulin gamma Fc region receptor III-A-like n=1 Tax=Acanthochromis polyacanthus TaxID=80966 RepID=UPI002233ED13|nr:low affinity immunoglobulin gamma Fc region receptor III-A-like [Acanthochromis polyacanthus]